MFEYYDYINKIPEDRYKKMSEILNNFSIELHGKEWYEERREVFENEGYQNWINMIRNNPNYHIIMYLEDNNIIGFICYEYTLNNRVCICEVQIIKEYRYKGLVKVLLTKMMEEIDKSKCDTFFAGINSSNDHSINTFTHIGMTKNDKYYEISYDDLNNYVNNKNEYHTKGLIDIKKL